MTILLILSIIVFAVCILFLIFAKGIRFAIKKNILELSHFEFLEDKYWKRLERFGLLLSFVSMLVGIFTYSNQPTKEDIHELQTNIRQLTKAVADQTSPQQITQGQTPEIEPSPETKQNAKSLLELLEQLKESSHEVPISVQLSEGIADIGLGNYEQGKEKIHDYLSKIDEAWNHAKSVRDENLVLSYKSLGNAAYKQAKYGEAEQWYLKALEIKPQDSDILNELGFLSIYLAKYNDGVDYIKKAISEMEKRKDTTNVFYGTLLNNLASLYKSQALYDKAESLFIRALNIGVLNLVTDNPAYAAWLNNLAELYALQGLYGKAESFYQRALKISEESLGMDHPSVAIRLNNLAGLYHKQRLYDKAESLYTRAIKIDEKSLGKRHPGYAAEYAARTQAIRDIRGE